MIQSSQSENYLSQNFYINSKLIPQDGSDQI